MNADYEVVGWDGEDRYLVFSPVSPDGYAHIYDSASDRWYAPVSVVSFMAQIHGWQDPVSIPATLLDECAEMFPGDIAKAGVKGASGEKDGHEFRGNQWWMMGPDGVPVPRPRPDKGDGSVSKPDVAPDAPKPPRTPRTRAPRADAEKTYAPVQTPIKWGKGVVPDGWTVQKQGRNKIIYTSARGNTAVLAVGARGWKVGDRYTNTVMTVLDKWATGKKIDFATERKVDSRTLAFVASGDPNTIGMGKHSVIQASCEDDWNRYNPQRGLATSAERQAALKEWDDLVDRAHKGDKDAVDKVEATLLKADDLAPKSLDKIGKSWSMGSTFISAQRNLEASLVHELGHSNFFASGHKISQMYGKINALLPRPHDWQKGQDSGQEKFVRSKARYSGLNFGGGVVVMKGQLASYLKDADMGSYTLTPTEQRLLRSVGATEYGAKKLQELVAESYAAYQLPNIPDGPLTLAVAQSFGWTKVQDSVSKAGSIPDMSESHGPKSGSNTYTDPVTGGLIAFSFTVDTLDGPKDITGDEVEGEENPSFIVPAED